MSRPVAVILAAGSSRRMGEDKAALPWLHGQRLLAWTVDRLAEAGWATVVVVGPHNESAWRGRLPRTTLVLHPFPERGKTTSLAAGLRALPGDPERILLAAVDQPRPAALYHRLAVEALSAPIVVPDRDGHRGHPVVVSAAFRKELTSLRDDALGLRGFLDAHREQIHRLPCPADWVRWDCNTPEAYTEALTWFSSAEREAR